MQTNHYYCKCHDGSDHTIRAQHTGIADAKRSNSSGDYPTCFWGSPSHIVTPEMLSIANGTWASLGPFTNSGFRVVTYWLVVLARGVSASHYRYFVLYPDACCFENPEKGCWIFEEGDVRKE